MPASEIPTVSTLTAPPILDDVRPGSFALCAGPVRANCVVDGDTFWFRGEKIRIGGVDVAFDGEPPPELLADAFARRERPLCLCCPEGVAMYIARFGDRHILKRMPETGPRHDVDCVSYEPPSGLSGLGSVEGAAIVENVEDGTTALKLGFSLSKLTGRAAPAAGESAEAGEARTEGARLSPKAMLHFLWDRAGFNRWRPAMAGRRNWAVLRKFLLDAAAASTAKGRPLAHSLYIPEMFDAKREEAIVRRRAEFLSRAIQSNRNRRSLAILIGEVKEIVPSRIGARLVVKHAPRFPFMLAEDVERRMRKVFANELALWNANADSHLVASPPSASGRPA